MRLVRATSPVYIEMIWFEEMPLIHVENYWLVLRFAVQRTPFVQETPQYRVCWLVFQLVPLDQKPPPPQVDILEPDAVAQEVPLARREESAQSMVPRTGGCLMYSQRKH